MKYKNYLIFCEVNEVNEVLGSTETTIYWKVKMPKYILQLIKIGRLS